MYTHTHKLSLSLTHTQTPSLSHTHIHTHVHMHTHKHILTSRHYWFAIRNTQYLVYRAHSLVHMMHYTIMILESLYRVCMPSAIYHFLSRLLCVLELDSLNKEHCHGHVVTPPNVTLLQNLNRMVSNFYTCMYSCMHSHFQLLSYQTVDATDD